MRNQPLNENLEMGDLKRVLNSTLHIDEYKSKMGDDADVSVISFTVAGKEPAIDLVSFIEKGYDWVLDADVSSGELAGGNYLVFVEADRTPELPNQIIELMDDIMNLSDQKLSDWTAQYFKNKNIVDLDVDQLRKICILTPEAYRRKHGTPEEPEVELSSDEAINQLKAEAGLDVDTKAPKNEFTENIRMLAGLK